MFNLLQSIFDILPAGETTYPETLIEQATERAVDGLDTRLRVVSGYRKKLRPSVIHAIDHVVGLVDDLPPPVDASRGRYGREPYLTSFFATADESQQFFNNNRGLRNYLVDLPGAWPERITGLLMMDRSEKKGFGAEMQGDMLRRDVAQVTVSFSAHQLMDPNGDEEETRRLLKHRAFDHLIELALRDVSSRHMKRLELEKQSFLLRRKLAAFEKAGVGFDTAEAATDNNQAETQRELYQLETQLKALPARTELLNASLDALIDVLSNAAQRLWSVPVKVIIDRMHVKRDREASDASELLLTELHSASGIIRTGVMVSYPAEELSRVDG